MKWYLLQTKPNSHVMAYKNLWRQGFDVFLPLIDKTTKKWQIYRYQIATVSWVPFYGLFNRPHSLEER